MIVQCEQCQTKFKIPDEKVSARGVKVRCTKCQHTFRVKRSADDVASTAPPPSPSKGLAPEDLFGEPPVSVPSAPKPPPVSFAPRPMPAFDPFGLDEVPEPPLPSKPRAPAFDPFSRINAQAGDLSTAPGVGGAPPSSDDPFAIFDAISNPPADAGPPPPPAVSESLSIATEIFSVAPATDDPFQLDVTESAAGGKDLFGAPHTTDPGMGMFDIPPPEAEAAAAPPTRPMPDLAAREPITDTPTGSSPLAKLQLKKVPASATKPSGKPEDMGMRESAPGAARRVAGWAFNLALGGALVLGLAMAGSAYVDEGKLDPSAFTLKRVQTLFARADFVTGEVSNGLYDTRAGRPVFYVRGEVTNRTTRSARLTVKAEILDGPQVLQSAEVVAGQTPTPEELFSLGGPTEVAALASRLTARGTDVPPGQHAPFLVVFFDYPPDLAGLRLRVSVEESRRATAEAR